MAKKINETEIRNLSREIRHQATLALRMMSDSTKSTSDENFDCYLALNKIADAMMAWVDKAYAIKD